LALRKGLKWLSRNVLSELLTRDAAAELDSVEVRDGRARNHHTTYRCPSPKLRGSSFYTLRTTFVP
jgi:hypothetical protein